MKYTRRIVFGFTIFLLSVVYAWMVFSTFICRAGYTRWVSPRVYSTSARSAGYTSWMNSRFVWRCKSGIHQLAELALCVVMSVWVTPVG